jgi:hypothetical protein
MKFNYKNLSWGPNHSQTIVDVEDPHDDTDMSDVPYPVEVKPSVNFNIPLIVRQHAPDRITQITQEIDELQKKIHRMSEERATLERLIKALDVPENTP